MFEVVEKFNNSSFPYLRVRRCHLVDKSLNGHFLKERKSNDKFQTTEHFVIEREEITIAASKSFFTSHILF